MSNLFNKSRRNFIGGTAVVTGAALGCASISLSAASAAGTQQGKNKKPARAPLFDPSLENYPGYSVYIAVPENLKQVEQSEEFDTALLF